MKNIMFLPLISLILFIVLIESIWTQIVSAPAVWDGTADVTWYTGNASAKEFTINTAEQLAGFALLVNGRNDFAGETIKLGEHIILNDTANWQNWKHKRPVREWIPIGAENRPFNGKFDGNGFIVSGVYINKPGKDIQGLFGLISSGAKIKNLGITASYIRGGTAVGGLAGSNGIFSMLRNEENGNIINSYYIGTVSGYYSVGGLLGNNLGVIIDSYSKGDVTGKERVGGLIGHNMFGLISNSYSTCVVKGTGGTIAFSGVGGLVGASTSGFITNSYSTGTVKGIGMVGGLVGWNSADIENSYSTSVTTGKNYVGGLTGLSGARMKNNYSRGIVAGDSIVGGLAGSNSGKIENSYSTGAVYGKRVTGGLVGLDFEFVNNSYYNIETNGKKNGIGLFKSENSIHGKNAVYGKTTAQMKYRSTFAGWDFNKIWGIDNKINDGYPHLLKSENPIQDHLEKFL